MTSLSWPAPLHRRRWLQGVGLAALATRQGRAASRPALTVRFSHVVTEETPKGLAVQRFKALVEQRSEGRIEVLHFPGAQLYGDQDELQALQLGAVEL